MKKILILFFLLIPLISYAKEYDSNEYWQLKVKMSNLSLPSDCVLLYTIVYEDPINHFKKVVSEKKETFKQVYSDSKEGAITYSWQEIFSLVDGKEVYYAINKHDFVMNHGFHASLPFSKAWLVTRAVHSKDEVLCWSIPLKKKKGKTTEIVLTDKNILSYKKLEKIYDSIIK